MALPDQADFVAWWGLQEASGTRSDETSNGNDLTSEGTGGVGQGTGIVDTNAADFESGDNDRLKITNASQTGLNITGDMTVGGWFKAEDSDNGTLIGKYTNAANGQYLFRIQGNNNRWGLTLVSGGVATTDWAVDATIGTGTFYFLVAVYDASAGTVEYYRDGSSIDTGTGYASSIGTSTTDFYLGSFQSGTANNYDGLMEQVFVADVAFTASQVSSLYNSGAGTTWADLAGGAGGFAFSQAVVI